MTTTAEIKAIDHRPWETKILEVLSDGRPHSRAEVMAAAAHVVDPLMALRALRKTAAWAKSEKKDEGLAMEVASGIQIILSKAISYMETRHLVDVAQFDDKSHRVAFTITDQGAEYLAKAPVKKPYAMLDSDKEWASAVEENGERALPACISCGQPVDPTQPGTWSQRLGWIQKRASGGANKIVKQSAPIAFAHEGCIS